ncbi:DNA-binding transcriptional regulator, IclR family [Bosea sp. CRIB-10]|uniref:IclR family transcriptional regulator n=1 Tax=Bosea sp. CRIB-10 TaxID=378404 RepID=UPI0008E4B941|nr:IclR family transcriptional regulator [Bosea sp. CRIB-10]SFD40124.1 DNA-binding transcriptional regulator, IclR family [Bosea sp. CRIB-10]
MRLRKAPGPAPTGHANGPDDDRHFVTALARGLDVLACFGRGEGALGNSEIAARCKLPPSTVSRITHTLTVLGYLHQVPGRISYRRGTALLALSAKALAGLDIRQLAQPGMQDLATFSQASVALGVRDRLSMRYIGCCRADVAIALNMDTGSRVPISRSAMGRAYIALCSRDEREALMEDIHSIDEAAWPKLKAGIEQALLDYDQYGCALSFGDWQPTVNAIAVAFDPGGGLPIMSINCGAPTVILERDFLLQEVRPKLRALASSLTGILGS